METRGVVEEASGPMRRLLASLAEDRPLVVVLDAHWAEATLSP
jgi:DTW domain-containing protein YfiP